ncbi:MAG: hypothetical protein NC123_16655 [Butyrivibrio sp.]|nr:hypothetical protein [Acetatifactor muris]MCM1561149.1 hypothetical protein [Butyrivibrio sp.]
MKSKLHFLLFPLYVVVVFFVLYVNGVFTGQIGSLENLAINIGFLAVIGVLFLISMLSFNRLNHCTDELMEVALQIQKDYQEAGGKNLWNSYRDRKEVFFEKPLADAFRRYRLRMRRAAAGNGYAGACGLEEYINEDLLDRVGKSHFNSGMSGTMTGLGILGTFLGLALGLGSFQGDDIYTISDNVGPLLMGMKVAFHTSVYGIFFSLVFNFIYRAVMADAYEKLGLFLDVFRQCVQPAAADGGSDTAMLVYQANIANSVKHLLELARGESKEQAAGVERIVNQFVEQMNASLGANFQKLGLVVNDAAKAQTGNAELCRELIESVNGMAEANRDMLRDLEQLFEQQKALQEELEAQKEQLSAACGEIGSQLYTFGQMRKQYEKQ